MKKFNFNLAFITDKLDNQKTYSLERKDAEGNDSASALNIKKALESLCPKVIMFDDIEQFSSQLFCIKDHVIFSTRYGEAFRSSKAHVPAICEANSFSYIGGDSFVHMLCNDKHLSKMYAREFGLNVPNGILIRNPNNDEQLKYIKTLKLPLVVKPNYGGGSNGILESNLKNSYDAAIALAKQLYQYQKQPILIEEYIPGNEVELILFGNKSEIYLCEETQLIIDGENYFNNLIWGLEKKKIDDSNVHFSHSNLIDEETRYCMKKLFQSFDKVEFMRIDCRVYDGKTYVLELSPDCYLGDDGGFYYGFEHMGYSYQEMLYLLILNSIYPSEISAALKKINNEPNSSY